MAAPTGEGEGSHAALVNDGIYGLYFDRKGERSAWAGGGWKTPPATVRPNTTATMKNIAVIDFRYASPPRPLHSDGGDTDRRICLYFRASA